VAAVELRNLTKAYGTHLAVNGISLNIAHGLLVCLLGPSGCGKTTTLRLLAGFMAPTSGEIRVGERVVSTPERTMPPERRNMSMIFQSYALWPHMTVAKNVAYGLTLRRLDRAAIAKKVADILAITRLTPLAERYPSELSGGQQQRVSLARALVVEPETLLLDEPLSNLDANLREEMRDEVRRLHDAYRYTTVYVTHDQLEAMATADLIAVMNGGIIEQAGRPEDIYDRPQSEFVARFIGNSNILRGMALDASHIKVAGVALAGTGDPLMVGNLASIAIRPHEIELKAPDHTRGPNELSGRVIRSIFLGAVRDYLVDTGDGGQLRVSAPPRLLFEPGSVVRLGLPAQCCRLLSR
jgi:iron(III) transport system ATP-binding protein